LRIIAGSAHGIRLAPVPQGVRPTSDRVREAVFNSLGQFFDGGEVLDLYAGTGALGIEAISRGCDRATFVEKNGRAARAIRENLRRAGFEDEGEVLRGDVADVLERLVSERREYNLIFVDPPYRISPREIGSVLERLEALLAPGGRLVVESGDTPVQATESLKGVSRHYGGTVVTFLERERSEHMMKIAICPGSFDPITVGHLDVIRRAASIFDHVIVAVGANLRKKPRLSAEDRAQLIEKVTAPFENVSVEVMDSLLTEFAREHGARVVVKGLRAVSDFESEFEQAQLNRTLYPEFETVFIMAAAEHSFLSSSAVREIAGYGGDVRTLVPEGVIDVVKQVYNNNTGASEQAAVGDKG
jgi:pantetheine-phosphate adenylyltransferase/16S rRNA (guanine(966)-N(2))-methyltransferase RsmD